MTNTDYPLLADSETDDLPRTLRREHEARARDREAREREAAGASAASLAPGSGVPDGAFADGGTELMPAAVKSFEVPFFRLMAFFLKAVLAAIPALILLGAILWGAGHILKMLFPWLIQTQITITFPH